MELWIRSQDRKSLKKVCDLSEHFGNAKYGVYEDVLPLGYYETEERALEVLDEIQRYINGGCKRFIDTGVYHTSKYEYRVYEMPLE